MPSVNSNKIAPISIAEFISEVSLIRPKVFGPTIAPTSKSPKTEGCLNRTASTPPSIENKSINPNSIENAMAMIEK